MTADSRYDLLRFEGLTAATPNEDEVERLLGVALDGDKTVEQAGWRLLERLGARYLLVTRGANNTYGPVYGTKVYNSSVYLSGSQSYAVQCTGGCSPSVLSFKNNIDWA